MTRRYGLVPTSLIDFPGRVAAVVFVPGCNLRCPWCHNPGLVRAPWDTGLQDEDDVVALLRRRRSVLGGVAVTGGEPLFQPDLGLFLDRVRQLGYAIKLDTNGTYPDRLAAVAPGRVDYVAVDIKNAPSRYSASAGLPVHRDKLGRTLAWLRDHYAQASEVRLTWVPGLNDESTLEEYAAFVGPGLPVWVQAYRPGPRLDPRWSSRAPTPDELSRVVTRLKDFGIDARPRA